MSENPSGQKNAFDCCKNSLCRGNVWSLEFLSTQKSPFLMEWKKHALHINVNILIFLYMYIQCVSLVYYWAN
jgi:hypothetical protein